MSLLVFVDDDESERVAMKKIAEKGQYQFEGIPPHAELSSPSLGAP